MGSVWLIHNNIPPYRVPLFAEITKHADFDFRVVLTAPKCHHRPHWQTDVQALPFRVMATWGLSIVLSDSGSVSVPLGLLPSLLRYRPNVVICSGFGLSTLVVYVYTAICRRSYVVWSEGTLITERMRKLGRLRQWIRRLLARHASAFVDAGTLAREYIRSLLPAESKIPFFRSYNCIDSSLFSSNPTSGNGGTARPATRRILFVGRLNQNKGIPMLLDVYADLLGDGGDIIELVLVGEGPLRAMVEEFRRSHESASVELAGQLPYSEVAAYYRSCDVFVLLSLSDCNPLVILEALYSGVPVVCTNRSGNAPDFIVAGENGYIVDPTDKDCIVRCLREVLSWNLDRRLNAARTSQRLVTAVSYPASARAFLEACDAAFNSRAQDRL
jgi:glycosyltransferase involved in cell wall biosynthesis